MLCKLANRLARFTIILASASPRRREILTSNIGISNLTVYPSTFEENIDKSTCSNADEYCSRTAKCKLLDVKEKIEQKEREEYFGANKQLPPLVLIAADTIVVTQEGRILEKPGSENDAVQMLASLSAREHKVITAVSLAVRTEGEQNFILRDFTESTSVRFANLDEETIKSYVSSNEPFDKAGSYGIQGLGGSLVEAIHGDYFNVVGFPAHRFSKELIAILENSLSPS